MTKTQQLRSHLWKGKTVSKAQALRWWNITGLSAFISDLRREGMNIGRVYSSKGNMSYQRIPKKKKR